VPKVRWWIDVESQPGNPAARVCTSVGLVATEVAPVADALQWHATVPVIRPHIFRGPAFAVLVSMLEVLLDSS